MPPADPPEGVVAACRAQLRDRTAQRRAGVIALVVGTVLTLVNQWGRVVAGDVDVALGIRIAVTYLVPFLVANLGAVTARLASDRDRRER